ncbi:MAG: S8 family serine peptidase, partial [Myxococcales bacterium]
MAFIATSSIASAADSAGASYLVSFERPPTAEQMEMLSAVSANVHAYRNLPAAAAVLLPADIRTVANLPGVRGVYANLPLATELRQSTETIRARSVWGPPLNLTGAGIGIAILDTGIDGTRPDLCAAAEFCSGAAVKTVQNVKFIGNQERADPVLVLENQLNTDTTSGHGSHVAGIAAGSGRSSLYEAGKYRGVAHGAHLVGLAAGEGLSMMTVLAAFDWLITNAGTYNIKVVNNSYGPGAGFPFDPEHPVQRAIEAVHDAGISVVYSAGNSGPTTGTLNAFAVNPKAIAAAGGTKAGHLAFFSSRGVPGSDLWRPTVTAPAQYIVSTRASTGFITHQVDATSPNPDVIIPPDNAYYASGSGTSQAAPHVSGVIALMQQAAFAARGRYLTPEEVKSILQWSAATGGGSRPGGLPNYQAYSMGAGYLDALAAVEWARSGELAAYDDGKTYAVQAFERPVPASGSISIPIAVQPGAISLDAMIDWTTAANDVDLVLLRPDGSQ